MSTLLMLYILGTSAAMGKLTVVQIVGSIIISLLATGGFSTLMTYWFLRRKHRAEAEKVELSLVGDQIDQASKIVNISTKLLEDVQQERETLVQMNSKLRKAIAQLEEEKHQLEDALSECSIQLQLLKNDGRSTE